MLVESRESMSDKSVCSRSERGRERVAVDCRLSPSRSLMREEDAADVDAKVGAAIEARVLRELEAKVDIVIRYGTVSDGVVGLPLLCQATNLSVDLTRIRDATCFEESSVRSDAEAEGAALLSI